MGIARLPVIVAELLKYGVILDAALFIVHQVRTQVDGSQPLLGNALPAAAAVLAHEAMALEQDENDPGLAPRDA